MLWLSLAIGVTIIIAAIVLWLKIFMGSKSLFAYELIIYMAGYGIWFVIFFVTTAFYKWNARCSSLFFYQWLAVQSWIFAMKYLHSAALSARHFKFTPAQILNIKRIGITVYSVAMFSLCVAHYIVYTRGHMLEWAIVIITANLLWGCVSVVSTITTLYGVH